MLLELPDALRENILRFLSVHSPDHLSLACSCGQLLQEVEAFSKKELGRITREHDVDDDWLYRAGMQSVVAGQQKAGWYTPLFSFSATYASVSVPSTYTFTRNGSITRMD
jgi:hypothetical protein